MKRMTTLEPALETYVRAIERIFRRVRDKHQAQEQARAVLLDMAADGRVLPAVLKQHVSNSARLNLGNFPSLGFEIALNPYFGLVANSFFPLPDGQTDLTANSVHHHGDMLLSTVTT